MAVTLSMAATPILYLLNEKLAGRLAADTKQRPFDSIEDTDHDVVIAGFGRFGQIVGRILTMKQIRFTALESSTEQVDFVRRFGNKIYYGDASRLELLRSARVDRAKVEGIDRRRADQPDIQDDRLWLPDDHGRAT